MNVVWTFEAREDLRSLYNFIARDSEFQALKQVDRIRLKIRWLTEKPVRGHPVHEFPESGCVEVHEGKYRIIYRITDEALSIVTVIHMKQRLDLERLR